VGRLCWPGPLRVLVGIVAAQAAAHQQGGQPSLCAGRCTAGADGSPSRPRFGILLSPPAARGKCKMVALVAVMRKLLHATFGMFKHDALFDGTRFLVAPRQRSAPPRKCAWRKTLFSIPQGFCF